MGIEALTRVAFNFFSWLVGFALTKSTTWAIGSLRGDEIPRQMSSIAKSWCDALPSSCYVDPAAIFPDLNSSDLPPAKARLAELRAYLASSRIPTVDMWHAALLEHWQDRKSELGETGQPFFRLSQSQADPHLHDLAARFHSIFNASTTHIAAETLQTVRDIRDLLHDDRAHAITDPDKLIDEACLFFTRDGKPAVSVERLRSLQKSSRMQTPRLRYRIHANIGNALLLDGRQDDAAEEFQNAAAANPDDPRARSCDALALFLRKEYAAAHAAASSLLQVLDDDERLFAIWIQTAPPDTSLQSLLDRIPNGHLSRPMISAALTQRLASQGDHDRAVDMAEVTYQQSDAKAEAAAELGCRLLDRQLATMTIGESGPKDYSRTDLQRAVALFSEALAPPSHTRRPLDADGLRSNRSLANRILGDFTQALFDSRTIWERHPGSAHFAFEHALNLSLSGDRDGALATLEQVETHLDPLQRVVMASWLLARNQASDGTRAANILQATLPLLSTLDLPRRIAVLGALVDAFERAGRHRKLLALLRRKSIARQLNLPVVHALRLRAFKQKGDLPRAKSEAEALMLHVSPGTDAASLEFCARQLDSLELWTDALRLFARLVSPDYLNENALRALDAARRCDDARFLLNFCRGLRDHDIFDERCLQLEVGALLRFNEFDEALRVLTCSIARLPSSALLRVLLSTLQIELGKPIDEENLTHALTRIDLATDVDTGLLLVQALRGSDKRNDAPQIAYTLLRHHFGDFRAHKAIIIAFMPIPEPPVSIAQPVCVDENSAVGFTVGDAPDVRWIIFEDDHPVLSQDERLFSSPEGRELAGKRVGDEFAFGSGPLGCRRGRICAILHKFVRRYQESMEHLASRFPGESFVESVRVPLRAEDGEIDPDALVRKLKGLLTRDQTTKAPDEYRRHFLPVYFIARRSGRSVFEAMCYLATHDSLNLRCCRGTQDERRASLGVLQTSTELVLDLCALASVYLAQSASLLRRLPFKLITSSGTLEVLRRLKRQSPGLGSLSVQDDRLTLLPADHPEVIAERLRFEDFVTSVEECLTIEGGTAILKLDAKTRESGEAVLGGEGVECLALSLRDGRALWTDDLFVAEACRHFCSVPRTWTQAVLDYSAAQSAIAWDDANSASARLLASGHSFLAITAPTVMRACELARWDPGAHPLARVLQWFGHSTLLAPGVITTCSEILCLAWRLAPLPTLAEEVARVLATAVLRRSDGPAIVRAIRNGLDIYFGLNALGARSAKAVLRSCLASDSRVIVP